MSIVRRLARPLLSAAFISNGIQRVRQPSERAAALTPLVGRITKTTGIDADPVTVARATGIAQVGAGALLAAGKLPRLSSSVLALTLVVDTATERFWKADTVEERKAGRTRFITGLSLLGGALLASVDTDGKPGVAWRAQHWAGSAKKTAKREAKRAARTGERVTKQAADALGL